MSERSAIESVIGSAITPNRAPGQRSPCGDPLVTIRVWGPEACFTPAHFRADPSSHPFITPSAQGRIFSAIYSKPEFEWEPYSACLLAPIRYSTETYSTAINIGPSRKRTLRTTTLLTNVGYLLTARLVTNPLRAVQTAGAYAAQAQRRMRRGNQYRQPYFGLREYAANWEYIEPEAEVPEFQPIDLNLGSMLLDLLAVDPGKDIWEPMFLRTQLVQGAMHIPREVYDATRDYRMTARHAYHAAKMDAPVPDLPPLPRIPAEYTTRTGPTECLLDALIERAASSAPPVGYEEYVVSWVLKLGPDGTFKGIEPREGKKQMVVPQMGRGSNVTANTGIDNFIYTLGAGGVGRGVSYATDRHTAYLDVIGQIDHPAARAVSAFLANPDRPLIVPVQAKLTEDQQVELAKRLPVAHQDLKHFGKTVPALTTRGELTVNETVLEAYRCVEVGADANHPQSTGALRIYLEAAPSDRLLISVEGHPDWWLSDVVLTTHQGRLKAANTVRKKKKQSSAWRQDVGVCSLCGEHGTLNRLFGSSKAGALITFNGSAWQGYHRTQGYTAPTCPACASGIARGLGNLASTREINNSIEKTVLLWWPKNPEDPNPWPLFKAAFSKDLSSEEREAALQQLPDSFLFVGRKMMARLSLVRFVSVSGAAVAERVRAWHRSFEESGFSDPQSVWMAATVPINWNWDSGAPKGQHHVREMEAIYFSLIAGEPLPPRSLRSLTHAYALDGGERQSNTNRRRRALMDYSSVSLEKEMTPRENCALLLGEGFHRVDLLQLAQRNPQRSLRITQFDRCRSNPRHAANVISDYGKVKRGYDRQKAVRMDPQAQTFLADALQAVNGHIPLRFTPAEQAMFAFGYAKQADLHRKKMVEKAAKKDEKKTENSDSDNDDNGDNATSNDNNTNIG